MGGVSALLRLRPKEMTCRQPFGQIHFRFVCMSTLGYPKETTQGAFASELYALRYPSASQSPRSSSPSLSNMGSTTLAASPVISNNFVFDNEV